MSWISDKDFFSADYGLGKTKEERRLFSQFWDRPSYTRWTDDHEEEYLEYLEKFQKDYERINAKPPTKMVSEGGVLRKMTYSELLEDLDPTGKPPKKPKKPTEDTWLKKMERLKKSGVDMDVSEFAFKGMPVYLVLEPSKIFNNSDADRAVINADGTEVLGRLGDPKFKTLFEKVKKSEEESSEEEPPPPPPDDDMPPPPPTPRAPPSPKSRECPKTPMRHATKATGPIRGPNPNRRGWKLPRKPYGHARDVVELEDDLTDAELKKMTSELPRRCLVDAVLDWAKDNRKIVLPSISRADKAEIVATIKEHRIPVPRMSGGGCYGDDMDDLLTGGQIVNEVHLCPDCRMGDDDFDFIENERRTTQPYEIAGGADPNPEDRKRGRDVPAEEEEEEEEDSMEDASEESEDDFARDIAFVCDECGDDVMWGSPEYAGRAQLDDGSMLCGNCADNMPAEEEDTDDEDDILGPPPPQPTAPEGYYQGGSIPTDKALYEKAKAIVYPQYKKPSAYRSGALVKKYKELGGKFKEQGERKLGRWFKEDWKDVGNKEYPVYRPTKRITKDTPLTPSEIDPKNLELRIAEKQKIKGNKNLSPFFHMRGGASEYDWGGDEDVYYDEDGKETTKEKYDELEPILPSQPQFVGDPSQFKIMPFDPNNPMMAMGSGKGDAFLKQAKEYAKKAGYKDWNNLKYANDGVHKLELNGVKFGRKGYGDFIEYGLKDGDKEAQKHRKSYLARATKMPGNWKDDKMSKNNLAIKVLWGGSPFHHLKGGAKQPALPPNTELVSKEESPVVEEIIEEPMDDGDIRAYYPNAKIIKYSDLKNYKTIQQLLPKDKSYAFLLYQHAPNNGHWVLIMRYGDTIEFFCSYGSVVDGPLKWTNPRDRQMLGEAIPYLTNLLKSQNEFKVIHNPVQYQSKGTDKATCGAHDVMRLSQMLNHGQDLTDYFDYMSQIKKESGLSYDEIVANFVSQR